MTYVYHHLPKNMHGTILYPLNDLKIIHEDAYKAEVLKYTGREQVTQQRIPFFDNCLWNDVIFLTATHPQDIYDARREAGWPDVGPQKYLKIDVSTLDESKLAIYLFPKNQNGSGSKLSDEDFVPYKKDTIQKYSHVPDATKQYFKDEFSKGSQRIALFYRYIPHVLYKGSIDISDVEVITVQ